MDGFSKLHFKGIKEDEKIIKVLHRNWFYIFQQFLALIVVTVIFFAAFSSVNLFGTDSKEFTAFFENFFMLVVWIYGFMIWVDYYFDIWIITDRRIVNIEQKGMFSRRVSEMEYSKMQDITVVVSGFLPTIINYGDVKVQTAAEDEEFVFRTVSDPYDVKNLIFNMQKNDSIEDTEKLGEMIREKIGA